MFQEGLIIIIILLTLYLVFGSKRKYETFESKLQMNELKRRNRILVDYVYKKYQDDPKWGKRVTFLKRNYNENELYEHFPTPHSATTSYTESKGKKMVFCLRDKEFKNGRYRYPLESMNTIMYCSVHELAHIMQYDDYGHKPSFYSIFKWLLGQAVELGLYTKEDYSTNPTYYCGMKLEHQVLDDDRF
tara:strand:+ start:407 stop:970 length:564 start_codon:yes stop_codon:yes gene_type:complete